MRGRALIAFGRYGKQAVVVWTDLEPLMDMMGEVGSSDSDHIALDLGSQVDRPDEGVWWAIVREDHQRGGTTADGYMPGEAGFLVTGWMAEAVDPEKAPPLTGAGR